MNKFSWNNQDYPIILCPPMDGITDTPFRELVAEMGGSAVRYCEFVNVKGILYENPKTLFELRFTEKQRPIVAQLFGNDPEDFYHASKVVVKMGFDAIDINMGCPAHKVAGKGCGCALMDNTKNASNIVKKTVEGANEAWREIGGEGEYEVTAKMRLGVNDKERVFEHGMAMIEAGAKAIAIHGRTLKQMYTGEADWEPIKRFKQMLVGEGGFENYPYRDIPVFGSGDVKSLYEAFIRVITTGVDGVMIGRGCFGNPWVFDRNKVELLKNYVRNTQKYALEKYGTKIIEDISLLPNLDQIKQDLENKILSFSEIKEIVIRHAELMVADKGEKGIVQMRKHLGWYFTNFEGAKQLRNELVRVNSLEEMKTILNNFSSNNL